MSSPIINKQYKYRLLKYDETTKTFGYKITASDNILAIYSKDKIYTYTYDGINWGNEKIINKPANSTISFGYSMAISGDNLFIGDAGFQSKGIVYQYKYNISNSDWTMETSFTNPESSGFFGNNIAISENILVVNNYTFNNYRGIVYAYKYKTTNWITNPYRIQNGDYNNDNSFGYKVSISTDNIIVIGSYYTNATKGNVQLIQYNKNTDSWGNLIQVPLPTGTNRYNGTVIAISNNFIVNYNNTGIHIIYYLGGTNFSPIYTILLTSQSTLYKNFGTSIHISSNNIIAITGVTRDINISDDVFFMSTLNYSPTANVITLTPIELTFSTNKVVSVSGITNGEPDYSNIIYMSGDYIFFGCYKINSLSGSVYIFNLYQFNILNNKNLLFKGYGNTCALTNNSIIVSNTNVYNIYKNDSVYLALTTANTNLTNANTALITATINVTNANTALNTATTDLTTANTNLNTATTNLTTANTDLNTATTAYNNAVAAQATAQTNYDNAIGFLSKLTTQLNLAAAAVNTTATLNTKTTAQTNYDNAVTAKATAQTNYDNAVTAKATAQTNYNNAVTAQATAKANYDNFIL